MRKKYDFRQMDWKPNPYLRLLKTMGRPVALIHLEALTGLAIRSVQVAVEGLRREGVLLKKNKGKTLSRSFLMIVTPARGALKRSFRFNQYTILGG